jgi:hypothetical protein
LYHALASESTTVEVDSALPVGALQLQNRKLLKTELTKGKLKWCRQSKYFCTPWFWLYNRVRNRHDFVYLSTSNTFKASPGTGNPDLKLIGIVTKTEKCTTKLMEQLKINLLNHFVAPLTFLLEMVNYNNIFSF